MSEQRSAVAVVEQFYKALAVRDAESIGRIADESFAEDAVLTLPASLPYGGRFVGAHKLKRMFVGMASAPAPVGPANLSVTELVDGGATVAAHVSFDWYAPGASTSIPGSAVEIWSFVGGRATSVDAYYWDTAACVEAVAAAS